MLAKFIHFITRTENRISVSSSVLAIISGLLFGLIIMIITNPLESIPAFFTIIFSGFTDIGRVLEIATPIILTGLSVGFAFKTGLFNIGAAGQLMVGAIAAIYVGVEWTFLPSSIHWLIALLAAGVAGAFWGAIPGFLKAYRNVHEVVATIMMNYIGLYFVSYMVEYRLYDLENARSLTVKESAIIPYYGLDKLFGRGDVNFGFIISLISVLIIFIILSKTTFGYQLKAVGYNKDASKYAGINEKNGIVLAMVISGLLAGLAGATIFLTGVSGRHLETTEVLVSEGFDGIPVALIGLSHPFGILFSALFIGLLEQGGFYMQGFNFAPEIIDIITSSIIYFSALVILFKGFIVKLYKKNNMKDVKG